MPEKQHLLTNSETAGFMLRHPLEAENILQTKAAIASGVYDFSQWIPGTIPPWGAQIPDSVFGLVVVFISQVDSEVYLTGNTAPIGDINKPAYVPPPVLCADGSTPIFGVCPGDVSRVANTAAAVGLAIAVIFGYQVFFAKK